jgi:hypothetical protein
METASFACCGVEVMTVGLQSLTASTAQVIDTNHGRVLGARPLSPNAPAIRFLVEPKHALDLSRSVTYVPLQLINSERLPREHLAHEIFHRDNPI